MARQAPEEPTIWDQPSVSVLEQCPPIVELVAKVLDAEGESSRQGIVGECSSLPGSDCRHSTLPSWRRWDDDVVLAPRSSESHSVPATRIDAQELTCPVPYAGA